MSKIEIAIIGAGLTGLSCAYHLKGRKYIILEKENNAGGLCRSITISGFTFDYTGHLIHLHTPYGKKFIQKMLFGNINQLRRNSAIYLQKKYIPFPFQANLWALPKSIRNECLRHLPKKHSPQSNNFYEWIINTYGIGIGKYFMIPYNEKLWTVPLTEINTDWVKQFIPKMTLSEILSGAEKTPDKPYGYNAYFYYPKKGGTQSLINALLKYVDNIHLGAEVVKILYKDKKIVLRSGRTISYSFLVSTIALPSLIDLLANPPKEILHAKSLLAWNSVMCFNLGIGREKITEKHWIYFPEKEFVFYRVGCYTNFSAYMSPPKNSSLYIEIAYPANKAVNSAELFSTTINDLYKCYLLNPKDKIIVKHIIKIPFAYVIYTKERNSVLSIINDFINKYHIYSIGRYGAWKYSFMEECILDGKKIADKLS